MAKEKAKTSVNNRDLCLYALFEAGGELGYIPTEEVAVRAFNLYPERFGLVRYPQYPDVDVVRVTLMDLRKEKHGSLVEGNKRTGWRITRNGLRWKKTNWERVALSISRRHPGERRLGGGKRISAEQARSMYRQRVLSSEAYRKQKRGLRPTVHDFCDLLRIDRYTPETVYHAHLEALLDAVKDEGDLRSFVLELAKKFGGVYRNA